MSYECPVCHTLGGYKCEVRCLETKLADLQNESESLRADFERVKGPVVIRGSELNASNMKFCKFLPDDMSSNGYQYKIGRNDELPGNFDPKVKCNKGLFFVPDEWSEWWSHIAPKAFDVTIPDDATVVIYPDQNKMKTDSLIITGLWIARSLKYDVKDADKSEVLLKIPSLKGHFGGYVRRTVLMSDIRDIRKLIDRLSTSGESLGNEVQRKDLLAFSEHAFWNERERRVAASIFLNRPPAPQNAYDDFLLRFKADVVSKVPSVNRIPKIFLTIHTLDRCYQLFFFDKGHIATYEVNHLTKKLVLDNIDFFESQVYWYSLCKRLNE